MNTKHILVEFTEIAKENILWIEDIAPEHVIVALDNIVLYKDFIKRRFFGGEIECVFYEESMFKVIYRTTGEPLVQVFVYCKLYFRENEVLSNRQLGILTKKIKHLIKN
jgi:hypothetical protein